MDVGVLLLEGSPPRRDNTGPPRSRLHRPKTAQHEEVDQTQVEDPKRICQASRDGGCGHKEDTGSPGHRRQGDVQTVRHVTVWSRCQ